VTVLMNKGNGTFENETSTYGLDQTEGLWQSVFILDQEEGISFAVGNYGLNSPYAVSESAPLTSYSLDFDGNEYVESVITQYINGKEWPLARKEVITGILPSLKKNFLNNESYALASIEDLFGVEKVAKSEKQYVRELRSGVFSLNEKNQFGFTPFDATAQLSPINDFEYLDVNDDGLKDLIFGAGMEYTEVEQGPMVALSLGLIIRDKENWFDNSAVNLLQGKAIKKIALHNSDEKVILLAENNGPLKLYNITW
ncbi:MAG: hypothetical protein RIA69_06190, partial [Cyclobacteriaceae bacterium]